MRGGAGDAVVGPAAAEGVDEGVVREFLGGHGALGAFRAAGAGRGDGDGPAVDVDGGDPAEPHRDARAREHLGEGPGLELLPGRELVQPDAFHEVGFGVDEGEGDVLAAQPPGEASGGDGSGVAGSEDDDAVLHVLLLSRASIRAFPVREEVGSAP